MRYSHHKTGAALVSGSFCMDAECATPKNQHVIRVNSTTFAHLQRCLVRKWLNLRGLAAKSNVANFAQDIQFRYFIISA
jgi:hypothetical protein